jgi:hypothetical protein
MKLKGRQQAAGRGALTDVDASLAAAVLLVFVSRSGMHGYPYSFFYDWLILDDHAGTGITVQISYYVLLPGIPGAWLLGKYAAAVQSFVRGMDVV